jgi:hypothetical protein
VKKFWTRFMTWLRAIFGQERPALWDRYESRPHSIQEAFMRDKMALAGDLQTISSNWSVPETEQETRDRILRGRVIAVAYGGMLHEVVEEGRQLTGSRQRSGVTRCRSPFLVKYDSMFLLSPRKLDCPHCLLKRAELN